jgi:hypothetical protein
MHKGVLASERRLKRGTEVINAATNEARDIVVEAATIGKRLEATLQRILVGPKEYEWVV